MSIRLINPIFNGPPSSFDCDTRRYVSAVADADGQSLELAIQVAINNFVIGCKADGIWDAIKSSCILAGARTLAGALVPLVGTAPTNVGGNFASGDYNRKLGLVGNGSTKYLNSNRAGNADAQDNIHLAVNIHTIHGGIGAAGVYAGNGGVSTGATNLFRAYSAPADINHGARCRSSVVLGLIGPNPPLAGLFGVARSSGSSCIVRTSGANTVVSEASQSSAAGNYFIFARENGSGSAEAYCNARINFFSIGQSLNLALLDARVTALISAIGAAIP